MSKAPRVSIVMRSMNSDWVIAQALAGLFSQTYQDFELVVVDSSTDRTLEIVNQYPHRLLPVDIKSYYPGEVLNMAISQIESEIIIFQNSDAVPLSKHSLERLVAAFDDPTVMAAFGRQLPRPEADPWVVRDYAISFPETGETPDWITFSLPFAGMRRSLWEQRPFYTDAFSSEDTEWGQWAKTNGHKIQYVPDAIAMHSHNYTFKEIYSRRYVEGEADAFIFGQPHTMASILKGTIRSTLTDLSAYAHAGEFHQLPIVPFRRFVYHWAYHKGHKLGENRLAQNDTDTSKAQEVVLNRYK